MPVRLSSAENSARVERFSPTTSTDLPRPIRADAMFTAVRSGSVPGAAVIVKEKPLTAVSIISWAFASASSRSISSAGSRWSRGCCRLWALSSRGFTPGTFSAARSRTSGVMAVCGSSPRLSFRSAKVEIKYLDSMVMPGIRPAEARIRSMTGSGSRRDMEFASCATSIVPRSMPYSCLIWRTIAGFRRAEPARRSSKSSSFGCGVMLSGAMRIGAMKRFS